MGRKSIVSALACGVCATVLLPQAAQAAQDRVSATEKGSVFIFSKVEVRYESSGEIIADTFLQLTNDNNEPVDVQMYFVNGDDPVYSEDDPSTPGDESCELEQPGWNWIDNRISLTANQPTYWSAATGLGSNIALSPWQVLDPEGPGREFEGVDGTYYAIRGFIVGWAVDADNNEIQFDHLAGTATLINYNQGSAWEYNAWSFQGLSVTGDGEINLDGVEYAPAYALLLYNFFADELALEVEASAVEVIDVYSFLTLHAVSADLRQETEGPVLTKAHMDVWNQNEVKFSGAYRCIECWDQFSISDTGAQHMNRFFLQTDVGKTRIDGLASQLCDRPETDCDGGNDSEAAAILGVAHKLIDINGSYAEAGGNLFGMGTENALIQYDPGTAPVPTGPANFDSKLNSFMKTFGLSR
jgi:hypothetical protein